MLFNSIDFLIFLPVVALVLYLIPGRFQWLWLLASSIFFYYTLLPEYLIIFFTVVLINYYLGIAIERTKARKNTIFVLSIIMNVSILAFFKYFGFFQSIYTDIKGLSGNDHLLRIILPVGLSFFIFTILSYLIELKRGTIKSERHIGIFASSLLFFPKIMQGPIEKPGNIFPQFRSEKNFNYDMVVEGLKQMLWGYFKKLVVADRLAIYVNAVYNNYEHHSGISLLLATVFYSFQIYADFSGYTDIALGSAKVLGFNLTNNFNRPYFATSIKEFWNRWHISFSVWLRDYLFLPLAFSFAGKMNKPRYLGLAVEKWIFLFASMITFAVCGLWHGEGLNFLIWGLIFGFYLTVANWTLEINKGLRKRLGIQKKSISYRIYSIIITFILVSFAWIFFRSKDIKAGFEITNKIFTDLSLPLAFNANAVLSIIGIVVLIAYDYFEEYIPGRVELFRNKHGFIRYLAYMVIVFKIVLFGIKDNQQFIYFQF